MLDNTWTVVYCTIVVDLQCFFGIIVVFLGCLVYALTPTLDRRGFLDIFRCSTFLLEACDLTAFPAATKHLCLHCSHTIWFPQETHIPIIHFSNHLSLLFYLTPFLRLDFTIDPSVSFSFELLVPIPPSVCLSLKVFRVSRDVSSINHVSTSLQQLPLIRSKDQVFCPLYLQLLEDKLNLAS